MKLNQKVVQAFKPGPRCIHWDDGMAGFGVRVTEGSCAYVVDFRIGLKRRRVSLGSTLLLTLADARQRAATILVAARDGIDRTVNNTEQTPTFSDVWRWMIDEVDRPKLAAITILDYEDRAKRLILPRVGHKRIDEVTAADVDRIVSAAKGQRNRAYLVALIKKVINHAKRARILPDNYRNPAADVTIKKTESRARALDQDQITLFGKALADMEAEGKVSPWLAGLLRLSLVCGLRPGEVRTLTWDRVNIEERRMRVVGKTGERQVVLTTAAISILQAMPRVSGCNFVFAGRRYGAPLVGVYKQLLAVQMRAGIERFRPYDLRHSAATGALAEGADVRAVQALLGHADLRTTQGYLHSSDSRRLAAAEKAAYYSRGVLSDES